MRVVLTAPGTLATIPCAPVSHPRRSSRARRAEARFWTGPAAHLVGGALDLAEAFTRWLIARARGQRVR